MGRAGPKGFIWQGSPGVSRPPIEKDQRFRLELSKVIALGLGPQKALSLLSHTTGINILQA